MYTCIQEKKKVYVNKKRVPESHHTIRKPVSYFTSFFYYFSSTFGAQSYSHLATVAWSITSMLGLKPVPTS